MKLSEAELTRSHGDSRRGFLRTMGSLTAAAAASPQRAGAAVQPQIPQVRIGKHSIPRLICGSNPFGGLSHISELIDREMHE
jgi:hypothetical protein